MLSLKAAILMVVVYSPLGGQTVEQFILEDVDQCDTVAPIIISNIVKNKVVPENVLEAQEKGLATPRPTPDSNMIMVYEGRAEVAYYECQVLVKR